MQTPSSTISSNDVQKILRLRLAPKAIGPLSLADTGQATTLEQIARAISTAQKSIRDILLTTGLGISDRKGVPVRLPAVLVPALQILEQCKQKGIQPPSYLVYLATDFIAESNHIDHTVAQQIAGRMHTYLQLYVQTLHPAIAGNVRFEFSASYTDSVRAAVGALANELRERMAVDAGLKQLMSGLEANEARHSNTQGKAPEYAAANIIYNGAIAPVYPFADKAQTVHTILPIGGPAEEPFFRLSALMNVTRQEAEAHVIPLITRLGSRPTYYPYPDKGDLMSVADYAASSVQDGPIRADIAALKADGLTSEVLSTIYPGSL